jgi:hypothetical protein
MTMQVTTYAPSGEVLRKYRELMERPRPPIVRDPKTGARRVALENLDRTHVYYLDPDGRNCSCEAGQNGTICHHRLVVAEWANRDALAAWVDDQDAGVELAFMALATSKRGHGAGVAILKRYESIWTED